MAHLNSFRKGEESEDIAKMILTRFSFITKPTSSANDLGADFICTLFENKKGNLFPKNSFAIQIKSKGDIEKHHNEFEITKQGGYINGLEIPFFVGVVDRENQKLSIYVGEYICDFLSSCDNGVKRIFASLIENRSEPLKMWEINNDEAHIEFPKAIEINSNYDYGKEPKKIKILFDLCRLIQENIASKISREFIFKKFNSSFVHIYAGSDSVEVFENNFQKRLAEVFFNLEWLHTKTDEKGKLEVEKRFKIYKIFYRELKKLHGDLPEYLTKVFDRLDNLIEK